MSLATAFKTDEEERHDLGRTMRSELQ